MKRREFLKKVWLLSLALPLSLLWNLPVNEKQVKITGIDQYGKKITEILNECS